MRQRVTAVAAVVAFAMALAVAVYVYRGNDQVAGAGQTPGFRAAPLTRAPLGSAAAPVSGQTSDAAAAVSVVFLGDDYTAGAGASSDSDAWARRVAKRLGVQATLIGASGAGYAKRGADGDSYQSLVGQVVAARPDVVVVSGGRNDVTDNLSTLRDDARTVFSTLHDQVPDAALLALAPWWGDSPHPSKLAPVDGAVRSGVEAARGTYLDIADPLAGHPEWMADEADPNDRGHLAIADAVTQPIAERIRR
jgi:acyl-CoA thioesterase I